MNQVSVLINNYNYGRYLRRAIETSLNQSYSRVEVVVVDDGSSDDSLAVAREYGDRIKLVAKENGGQGSAYNAGLENSSGAFVMFLDSDDLLDVNAVETCVAYMKAGVSKVQFSLRVMDAEERPLGRLTPHVLHDGDVRPIVKRFGTYGSPPGSGNLYRRDAIDWIFPLKEKVWRRAADTAPIMAAAFRGDIASVPVVLGSYRVHHGGNVKAGVLGNILSSAADGCRADRDMKLEISRMLGLDSDRFLPSPISLRIRAMSWKLDRDNHPYENDSMVGLIQLAVGSFHEFPGLKKQERLVMFAWTLALLLAPPRAAQWLAGLNNSGRLRRLFRGRGLN